MPVSTYDAVIPTWIQIAGSVRRLLDKAEAWCGEQGIDPTEIVEARLIEDMWTFAFQVKSVQMHSARALEGLRSGQFSPSYDPLDTDFAGLRATVDATLETLQAVEAAELEGLLDSVVHFEAGQYKIDFSAQDFLFSFAQPNFFFHAVTAYDILRARGMPIGKLDYLGAIRARA